MKLQLGPLKKAFDFNDTNGAAKLAGVLTLDSCHELLYRKLILKNNSLETSFILKCEV